MGGGETWTVAHMREKPGTFEPRTPPLGGPAVFRTRECEHAVTGYSLP